MLKRTVTALTLFAIGLPLLLWGGTPFISFMTLFYVTAGVEYVQMFHAVDTDTNVWLVAGSILALVWVKTLFPTYAPALLTLSVLILMIYHTWRYEQGRDQSARDFGVAVAGVVYLGWVAPYLIQLRLVPLGGWWLFLVLMSVWIADTGAYMIGSAYGKHKLSKRISPKKSWEGYFAGVVSAAAMGGFLAYSFSRWGPMNLEIWRGAVIGLVIGILAPAGDLGVSMIKRYSGFKDSGTAIPGHGGAFDRIDSWIMAGVIGMAFWWLWG
ncbi:MAG TPA: phosphatidate cytidylyltransferase [Anaerolineales bacterium]|nr:phosphatidate cytidylyltransferase [Anaerolineales bacterium]